MFFSVEGNPMERDPHAFSLSLSIVSGRWPAKSYSDLLRYYFGRYTVGIRNKVRLWPPNVEICLREVNITSPTGERRSNLVFPPGYTVSERKASSDKRSHDGVQPDMGSRF